MTLAVSTSRLLAVCVIPIVAAGGLFTAASFYEKTIPEGEMAMRTSIVGVCMVLGALAALISALLLAHHCRRTFEVESDTLTVSNLFGSRQYPWGQVTVGFPQGHAGLRHVTLGTPDGSAVLSEVLYPSLHEGYGVMSDRAAAARNGIRH